ncbi:MAG: hypothetical protein GF419_08465 [Ignavibacteriales bacterium]|nr:hypothetical protein [Ignavibacteriales bacterium]
MKRSEEHEREEHRDVAALLGKLPRKKAPAGFESRLMRRINAEEYDRHSEPRRAKRILTSSRFLPLGAGAAIIAIVALLVTPGNGNGSAEQLILEPERVERLIDVDMSETASDEASASREKGLAEERAAAEPSAKKKPTEPKPEIRAEMAVTEEAPPPPTEVEEEYDVADAEYGAPTRDRSDDRLGGAATMKRRAAIPERNVYESQSRRELNFIRAYTPPEEEQRRIDSLRSRVAERLDSTGR